MGHRQPGLEVADELESRPRPGIATIEESMDADRLDALPGRELDEGNQVAVVGVDAARSDQADDMKLSTPDCPIAGGKERRSAEEGAVGDGGVDPRQILEDRASGSEIEMAHFRVAHLTGR